MLAAETSPSDISRFRYISRFRKSEPLFGVRTTHPECASDSDIDQVSDHLLGNLHRNKGSGNMKAATSTILFTGQVSVRSSRNGRMPLSRDDVAVEGHKRPHRRASGECESVSQAASEVSARFDDPNLGSCAVLAPALSVAEHVRVRAKGGAKPHLTPNRGRDPDPATAHMRIGLALPGRQRRPASQFLHGRPGGVRRRLVQPAPRGSGRIRRSTSDEVA